MEGCAPFRVTQIGRRRHRKLNRVGHRFAPGQAGGQRPGKAISRHPPCSRPAPGVRRTSGDRSRSTSRPLRSASDDDVVHPISSQPARGFWDVRTLADRLPRSARPTHPGSASPVSDKPEAPTTQPDGRGGIQQHGHAKAAGQACRLAHRRQGHLQLGYHTAGFPMSLAAAVTCLGLRSPFDPAATAIMFSPPRSSKMSATPLGFLLSLAIQRVAIPSRSNPQQGPDRQTRHVRWRRRKSLSPRREPPPRPGWRPCRRREPRILHPR